jgi:CheY-like chemotaxis protein
MSGAPTNDSRLDRRLLAAFESEHRPHRPVLSGGSRFKRLTGSATRRRNTEVLLRPNRSVLIVDPSPETRDVLRTALERQGTRVLEAAEAQRGLELARQHCPDVIVLDLELDAARDQPVAGAFQAQSQLHATPLVMLGSARRLRQTLPTGQFIAKPYHYGPLIRKIEELLEGARRPLAESA